MPNEPTDHAVTRGRDVSLGKEAGHSPENHTVVLETTDGPQRQRTSQTSPYSQQNTLLQTTRPRGPNTYHEPTITKGAMLSSGVGGASEASRKM